jgi:glycosyltransferase involved in cell wall biosynthesis
VHPHFRVPTYREPGLMDRSMLEKAFDPRAGLMFQFIDGARLLAEDMDRIGSFDAWIWPSLNPAQLLACARAQSPRPVAGCIHTEPGFDSPADGTFWRYAFVTAIDAGLEFRSGALTPELALAYTMICPEAPTRQLPSYFDAAAEICPRSGLQRIGFFGHQQRGEKGHGLLSVIIPKLLDQGYQVLLHDSSAMPLSGKHERLEVLGYEEDLGIQMRRCDLIVVPYQAESYRQRGSGIVWEAIANGIPLVAPERTAPGHLIGALGCGCLFGEASVDAILGAIRQAHAVYTTLAIQATTANRRWAEAQGIGPFIDRLLSANG